MTSDETMGDVETKRGAGAWGGSGGRAWAETMADAATKRAEGGTVLAGRYRVVGRLGEGGMGSVWLAEDLKLDGKRFAIKMLPSVLAGRKGAYKQVKAEAMVAMKLSHPNIATVRAFEEDEGGSPFLVMDYIEGTGLDEILAEKGALGEEETRRLLGPVAAALDYAHSQGVVHRDVKPGNVMVRRDGTPFVLDFGIAREIQETMTRVTGTLSSGTLLYMSPEQLRGRAPKAAQDVYSFAAMAYECLAGHPPFYRGAIEDQIKNEPPEALPEGVGEALRAGVMAGLAKEAEGRPGSCAGVLGEGALRAQESGVRSQESVGGEEERTARPEGSAHRRTEGGRGGDVFLRKVRLEKAMGTAREEYATAEEKTALEGVQERFEAGAEALRAGDKWAAESLFSQVEGGLAAWRKGVRERREREEREARARAEREAREREEREAREREARERVEREAREREARERAERKERLRLESEAERERIAAELRAGDTHRAGEVKRVVLSNGVAMKLVWCPAGTFMMGSPGGEEGRWDNETQHRVTLTQGFWMGETEVTQGVWREVMGTNPSHFKDGDNYPVESVSWEDCQEFVETMNARYGQKGMRWALPTEAQWEYACRAGTGTAYFWGNALKGDRANCDGNYPCGTTVKGPYKQKTTPVGSYAANAWGLYDMHGNVWEWCADWYGDYPRGAVTDPSGPSTGSSRVRRGGSWLNGARGCRSADRRGGGPGFRGNGLGLRVALLPVR